MIFLGVILAAFLAEVGICSYVNSNWLQGRRKEILGGRLSLHNCHNSAGAFGLFGKDKKLGEYTSIFTLGGAFWAFFRSLLQKGHFLVKLGWSLIAGGGLGNCYERLSKGFVTDYICVENVKLKSRRFVFNLADAFIVMGGLFIGIGSLAGLVRKKK